MAKRGPTYICQACGAVYHRWQGKCDSCGTWSSLSEEAQAAPVPGGARPASGGKARGRVFALETLKGDTQDAPRITSGIGELDRVTGGGFVPGSVLLIGGNPGIGKSTLLMQACAALAQAGRRVVYVSGEESTGAGAPAGRAHGAGRCAGRSRRRDQCRGHRRDAEPGHAPGAGGDRFDPDHVVGRGRERAGHGHAGARFGPVADPLRQDLRRLPDPRRPCHQGRPDRRARAWSSTWSTPCSPSRAKACTPSASCAPQKNRFGPTDEIGVFEMTGMGLSEVSNPSALFLAGRDQAAPGAAVFAGIEGTRPVLVEIQALVAPTSLGTPRRAVVGWENSRLAMVLAVLETHGGLRLGQHDVYLNVAGGMRVNEPAADVAVAAALVSSLTGAILPPEARLFRRDRAVGRDSPGLGAAGAAARSVQARLRGGADAGRRRRCRRWRRPDAAPFRPCHGARRRYCRPRASQRCEMKPAAMVTPRARARIAKSTRPAHLLQAIPNP